MDLVKQIVLGNSGVFPNKLPNRSTREGQGFHPTLELGRVDACSIRLATSLACCGVRSVNLDLL